jgi:hypothetical protein
MIETTRSVDIGPFEAEYDFEVSLSPAFAAIVDIISKS